MHLNEKYKEFLRLCLDFSEAMLRCGAEIDRIEDTVTRMGLSFGAKRVNVFAITASIVVTLEMPDGEAVTETRRIVSAADTDFTCLENLNRLSREFCSGTLGIDELKAGFDSCVAKKKSALANYLGSLFAAGGFSVFFGGTVFDGLVSAAVALLICVVLRNLSHCCPNTIVMKFLCALFSGLAVCAVCRVLPALNADKIMIGDIMLLIPGINLTNAISNIIVGDTISGIMRLTESLMQAAALAAGFMLAILAFGG